MNILTGENLSLILVANMDLIYWNVCSSSMKAGDEIIGVDGGRGPFFANCKHHFIKVHYRFLQFPSNPIYRFLVCWREKFLGFMFTMFKLEMTALKTK